MTSLNNYPDLRLENQLKPDYTLVAGIDEAGRGPLAGPVVAACVLLPCYKEFSCLTSDSKGVSEKTRRFVYNELLSDEEVYSSIGVVFPEEIDRINILQATHLAMKKAYDAMIKKPDFLLVDGISTFDDFSVPILSIVKGDTKSLSIACASVLAKVYRDDMLLAYHDKYPEYGFNKHKGYPTKFHKEMLLKYGVTPIHRKTFAGVKEII